MAFVPSKGLVRTTYGRLSQKHTPPAKVNIDKLALTRKKGTSVKVSAVGSQVARGDTSLYTDLEMRILHQREREARLGEAYVPAIKVHRGAFAPLVEDF